MLALTDRPTPQMVAHAYDGLPLEACGLLGGDPTTGKVTVFYPCRNTAASARVYTVDPKDHLRADRDAEQPGPASSSASCTATPTPRPTRARPTWPRRPTPRWHYVIVSLKREAPVLRSYRIVDGEVAEEAVELLRQ